MEIYDFVIIGAGIAGASAAYELAEEGSVLVLEQEDQPGYHATGRSAAFFSETYGNAAIRNLTAAARPFFEAPPQDFCKVPLLKKSGALFIGRQDQNRELETHARDTKAPGRQVTLESADFARLKCPILDPDYLGGCVWEPASEAIDVNALLQGFFRGARRRGAIFKTKAPVTSITHAGAHWQVRTGVGTFDSRVLVNAAGAWADEIARLAGVPAKSLSPLRRTVCVIDGPKDHDSSNWPLVIDIEEAFYFKPDAGKLWLSPADETLSPPCDAYADDMDVALAVDRFETATLHKVARVHNSWAGLRTFAPDMTPIVGFDKAAPSFFWLAGQGGYGIQTSPTMAKVTKAIVTGEDLPTEISRGGLQETDLSPHRFS